MRRLILAFVGLLLTPFATPFAAAQVIGVQPTPMAMYGWDSTGVQFNKLANTYALFPAQSTPQPFAFYGWNSSLQQWIPCDMVTHSCPWLGGGIANYPAGTGVVTVAGGAAWGTTLGTLGSGNQVILPNGSPVAGEYIDGATFSWTTLPFKTLTTNGNAGPASLSGGVLNIPIYSNSSTSAQCFLGITGLAGAFTDGSGIVSLPLCLGNGPTSVITPNGATQLQLGIDDNRFSDNTGSFTVAVSKNGGATTPVTVGGTAMPWSPSANPTYTFGVNDGASPVIALSGLVAGDVITISYVSGTVQCGIPCPPTDGNGWLTTPPGSAAAGGPTGSFSNGFGFFPTKYMTSGFASGAIIGLNQDVTAAGPGDVPATVVGILGHALPSLSSGYPHWNGTSWVFDTPSGTGMNQLTSDVLAGPGSGSQSATVVGIHNVSVPTPAVGYLFDDGSTLQWVANTPGTVTSATSITASCQQIIRADSSSPITLTLPTVTAAIGSCPISFTRGVSAGAITVAAGGPTFDGPTGTQQPQGLSIVIWTDGTNWHSTAPIVAGTHCTWTPGLTGNTLDCSGGGGGTTISSLTYTATDTTIVAAWTTSSAADSNLFCGGKPAIDNGFQQGLTTGHLAIVTGLNPSSPYSCYVVSAGTSSSVSTTSTSSPTTRIAIRTGSLGSVSSWTTTGQGDNPYNVVSSDGNTYAVLDDTTVNSLNAAQAIVKFTNETNMTASTINAMTAFGAQAVFNGTDGPGRTGMSNKLWGLWSQSGILCAWEGRISSGFPQSSWYPWLMCDHGDHGATWNTWQAPTTYTSTGTEIQGAGMFPFGAIGTVSFVNYAADDGTVGYTTSGNGIDGANGWVYMNFNDGWWNGGNYLYMMRVPRVYLNSQASYTRYQFWKGPANPTPDDFTSDGNWTSSFVDKVPILSGFGTVGAVNEVFVPGFNYYVLNVSAAGGPYFNPGLPSGNVFTTYSAPTPAGPFTQIYTHTWGTSTAYYDQTFMMRPIQTNVSTSSLAVPLMFADQNADNLHYATFTMNSQVGLSLASFCGGGTAGTAATSISIATNSTCSGSMNVATGNSLLVGVLADTFPNNSSIATRVFDTAGNTFIPISVSLPGPGAGGGGALTQQSIWYLCNNCNGNSADVITAVAQYAGTTPYSAIGVWQIAGGTVAGDGNVKVAFTASGTSIATSSFNTTFTNELCAAIGSKNGTSTVGTAGAGFSLSSASIWGAQYTGEHAIFTSTQTGLAPSMSWTSGQLSIWEACVGH